MLQAMEIEPLLAQLVECGGSDLHLKAGMPPIVRRDGQLQPLDAAPLREGDPERLAASLLPKGKQEQLAESGDAEIGISRGKLGRFRVSVFTEQGRVRLAVRKVWTETPSIQELNLPRAVADLAMEPRGLLLVTGEAGTGKTTTIASMIGLINHTRRCHIVTIEDPVEVVFNEELALIDQREIGMDVPSYAAGMKYVVRQDPDVIFIGEIRDQEAAEAALQAAETGHLVISTMHTTDATETVNRLIDLFPVGHNHQVRVALASALRGVVSQRLLPRADGEGRVPAVEILIATGRVRDRILDPAATDGLSEVIEEGRYYGMQSFDEALLSLVEKRVVSADDARLASSSPHDFALALRQAQLV
jgi:twitching motility protein PilT